MKFFKKLKKFPFFIVGLVAVIITAALCLWINHENNLQSTASIPLKVTFQGEYKIADGEFKPIVKGKKIYANKGDVTLRGYFRMEMPDGEVVGRVPEGCLIALYFNHVSATVYAPGQEPRVFDAEHPFLKNAACGETWLYYEYTATESETIEIVLHNPHKFGNVTAYDDFLDNMHVYTGGAKLENELLSEGNVDRTVGFVLITIGLLLLGIALYVALLRLKQSLAISHYGFITLFMGLYFIFSAKNVSIWSSIVSLNTAALIISFMLYTIFLGSLVVCFLEGKIKTVGKAAVGLSGISAIILMAVTLFSDVRLYDIQLIWRIIQALVNVLLFVLICIAFRKRNGRKRFLLLPCALSLIAYCLDFAGMALGCGVVGLASKLAFIIILLSALIFVLMVMPYNVRAAQREQELIAERNRLQMELQSSQISVMLTQIQPHFLYNMLNTIHYLCGKDAKVAQNAISSFSDYLRHNLESIDYKELIGFDKELQNINTYLDLEKIRYGDELEIVYDIQTAGFFLPILTVQPLVENAVKHGIAKKRGGGRVTISTREYEDRFEVTVSDTGVGFDPERYAEDGKEHIGIHNVRERLDVQCKGRVEIFSEIDRGTRAIVILPKNRGQEE